MENQNNKQMNQLEENQESINEYQDPPINQMNLPNPESLEFVKDTFSCKVSSYRYDVAQLSQLAFNMWTATQSQKEGKDYFN